MSKSSGTILLTGGTGKVARRIAPLLSAAHHPFIVASRSAPKTPGIPHVKFDYSDPTTYTSPFLHSQNITAIFLVAPPHSDMFSLMKDFIDFAIQKGVKRMVLLSASTFEAGGMAMGEVHAYLKGLDGIEWAVLRPTWFMQNLSEQQLLVPIRDRNQIFSATGQGKIPWVSCDDVAEVAYRALTDEVSHNTEHLILGPELLSYDDLADILTELLGRKIKHIDLTSEQLSSAMKEFGVPGDVAQMLVGLDEDIKAGKEARLNGTVRKVTGKEPTTFKEFAESVKVAWEPKE